MIKKIIKGLLIAGMILSLAWGGLCVYANVAVFNQTPGSSYPDVSKAMYAVSITNTGNLLFTNDYEYENGVYTLHGFYTAWKSGYIYRKQDITLDEKIFGKINVKTR